MTQFWQQSTADHLQKQNKTVRETAFAVPRTSFSIVKNADRFWKAETARSGVRRIERKFFCQVHAFLKKNHMHAGYLTVIEMAARLIDDAFIAFVADADRAAGVMRGGYEIEGRGLAAARCGR